MAKILYRCPHCGEKGISYSDRLFACLPRRTGDNAFGDYDLKCRKCNGKCWTGSANTIIGNIISCLMVGSIPLSMGILFVTKNSWACFAVLFTAIFIKVIYNIFDEFSGPVFMMDEEGNCLSFMPNTKAEIEQCKYLKAYGIYRLKFKNETENHKFIERFQDGMVPAQIAPSDKDKGVHDLRIIGRDFVPDEVLFEGAEFEVEDIDGIFITKGKITKTGLGN